MKYRVIALGLVNAGKSTLLSALADREELFPSGDVPGVTRKTNQQEVGPLLIEDTPGLDADVADEHLAMNAGRNADTILWCHSLRMGDLRQKELDALALFEDDRRLIWRTCFVLTHRDDVASRAQVQVTSKAIAKQLEAVFGLPFVGDGEHRQVRTGDRAPRPFDYIGAKTYWKGRGAAGRRADHLVRRSGVPALRKFLFDLARRKDGRHQ